MISRNKKFTERPDSLNSDDCMKSLRNIIEAEPKDRQKLINDKYYAADDVRKALKDIYGEKCAYCESPEDSPEIEHYRPKGRVTNSKHGGYYWLCYEWSNLLPACHDCNKPGAKGNHFPIHNGAGSAIVMDGDLPCSDANLVTSHHLLGNETPLLLNPEIPGFNPFDFFQFNASGQISVKSGLRRNSIKYKQAHETIDKIELDRYKLEITYRKTELRKLYKKLRLLFFQFLEKELTLAGLKRQYNEILSDIRSNSDPSKPYSFFWNYVFDNFNQVFITSFFKPKHRKLFFDLTTEFKTTN